SRTARAERRGPERSPAPMVAFRAGSSDTRYRRTGNAGSREPARVARAGLPLNQGIAVTGAVNQHGEVQAVGGVTRKVEGFYDVCRERGLTGEQGVMVPAANVKNLMLNEEVVEAVRAGRFHVWAVSHIDEGIELLMERVAGERAAHGRVPAGTVHRLVPGRPPDDPRPRPRVPPA